MNRTLRNTIIAAAVSGTALAAASSAMGASIVSGASFPGNAYTKWCQESKLCSYTSKGSTGGINDLINGVADIAATDAPLTAEQRRELASKRGGATPVYFPTLIGAISVPANIDGVRRGINFDGRTLADIFRGTITNWNNAAIRRANPGVRLPNAPITLCVRSDGSGTSFGFTSYLAKMSPAFRRSVGVSQQPNWPTSGITVVKAPRNPGVAQCIKSNRNSVGYVDISDARDAGLTPNLAKIGKSQVERGRRVTKYILPSSGASSKAANLRTFPPDLVLSLTGSPARDAYPITITTWLVTYSNYSAAGKGGSLADVKKVLNYVYGARAQGQLRELRFAPLPPALITAAKRQIARVR